MSTVARAANGDKIAALQVAAQVAENTTAEERQQAMAIAQQTHGVVQGAVTEQQKKEGGMAALGGAALAAGVTGAVLAGPVIAVGAAAGGAYAATRNDGVGDAARKIGVGTTSAISAANQYNQEHHVTQRAYDGTKQALHAAATNLEHTRTHHADPHSWSKHNRIKLPHIVPKLPQTRRDDR